MRPHVRAAYTLMEVTLALSIALLLLAALYTTFWVWTTQTNAGRNVANQSNVARSVFTRLTEDINCHLSPIDPRVSEVPAELGGAPQAEPAEGTEGDTSGDSSQTTNSNTTSNSTTNSNSATQKSDTTDPAAAEQEPSFYTPFNFGVQGDSQSLTLYVTKVPRRRTSQVTPEEVDAGFAPDLRRVTYWLAQGPSGPLGLAREELDLRANPQALQALPFALGDQEQFVIARDVVSVQFEYFNGTEWVPSWDGMQPGGLEGKSPIGPPMAIAIIVEVAETIPDINGERPTRLYRHVVDVPTANGPGDANMILPQ
jgi:hypothetical protein